MDWIDNYYAMSDEDKDRLYKTLGKMVIDGDPEGVYKLIGRQLVVGCIQAVCSGYGPNMANSDNTLYIQMLKQMQNYVQND